jgi:hypothetical protein
VPHSRQRTASGRFSAPTAQRPGKEEGEKADQPADHDLPAPVAIPLLLAQCHAQAVAHRLKRHGHCARWLVAEEAPAALPNLDNHALVAF